MGTTIPSLPLPLVSVRGTPFECGAGYGSAAAELVAANLALYLRRFRDQAGLDQSAVRAAGDALRRSTTALHPRVGRMLDGVAEGAGVNVAEVYALNARTELIYGSRPAGLSHGSRPAGLGYGSRPEGGHGSGPDGGDGGCTAVGVLGTHTASGHLLLGQNWDWHPDQREAMVLLATRDERDHAVLALAEAGMLAKTGLNSAGVGVCVNMLGCDRDGLPRDGRAPGVPYHVLLRAALEADNLSLALRAAFSPRNASINLLVGQAAPGGGELIDLELVPGDAAWSHPVGGLVSHANHLETSLPVYDTIKDLAGSSLFRSARARRLLAERSALGKVDEADLAELFRDHASYPSSICRHVDERDAPPDRSETVYSVLLDLDARRFGLAAGPPCGHDYTWLDLPAVTS